MRICRFGGNRLGVYDPADDSVADVSAALKVLPAQRSGRHGRRAVVLADEAAVHVAGADAQLQHHGRLASFREFEAALDRIATNADPQHSTDIKWFAKSAKTRLHELRRAIARFTPWMLPDFADLRKDAALALPGTNVALKDLPDALTKLEARLQKAIDADSEKNKDHSALLDRLLSLVSGARMDCVNLIQELQALAADAERNVAEMDFSFLWSPRRKLLSIGFESEKSELHSACYDLLASEARIAVFIGIAKDEVPQDTWFLLARTHTIDRGRPVLLSWTGTMFEYLMPGLWMHTYTGTLLDRSRHAAVRSQQEYTASKRIPWGISESAFATRDAAGNYGYHAFGIPQLALNQDELDALVISPYSTFLALTTSPRAVLENLRKMSREGWFGTYGFYESADFSASQDRIWRRDFEIVRCWMAHHQGMSLLSIANFLADEIVQEWFHAHPRVQATELLLHEKPVNYLPSGAAAV